MQESPAPHTTCLEVGSSCSEWLSLPSTQDHLCQAYLVGSNMDVLSCRVSQFSHSVVSNSLWPHVSRGSQGLRSPLESRPGSLGAPWAASSEFSLLFRLPPPRLACLGLLAEGGHPRSLSKKILYCFSPSSFAHLSTPQLSLRKVRNESLECKCQNMSCRFIWPRRASFVCFLKEGILPQCPWELGVIGRVSKGVG